MDLPTFKPMIEYHDNGQIALIVYFDAQGQIHRSDDQPALVRYYQNGIASQCSYYHHGQLHRNTHDAQLNTLPAYEAFDPQGHAIEQRFLTHGEPIRHAPFLKQFHKDGYCLKSWVFEQQWLLREEHFDHQGHLFCQSFYDQYQLLHRIDAPAFCIWYPDGTPETQTWYQHGNVHRESLPAHQVWYPNGHLRTQAWYAFGQLHRQPIALNPQTNQFIDQPALIKYHLDQKIAFQAFYAQGKIMDPRQLSIEKYKPETTTFIPQDPFILHRPDPLKL